MQAASAKATVINDFTGDRCFLRPSERSLAQKQRETHQTDQSVSLKPTKKLPKTNQKATKNRPKSYQKPTKKLHFSLRSPRLNPPWRTWSPWRSCHSAGATTREANRRSSAQTRAVLNGFRVMFIGFFCNSYRFFVDFFFAVLVS